MRLVLTTSASVWAQLSRSSDNQQLGRIDNGRRNGAEARGKHSGCVIRVPAKPVANPGSVTPDADAGRATGIRA
jgi:hypothetical protein